MALCRHNASHVLQSKGGTAHDSRYLCVGELKSVSSVEQDVESWRKVQHYSIRQIHAHTKNEQAHSFILVDHSKSPRAAVNPVWGFSPLLCH